MALIIPPAAFLILQDTLESDRTPVEAGSRDLAEAEMIARGQLKRCAEVRHLIAMAAHIADLREAIEVRDQLLSALTSGTGDSVARRS